MTRFTGMALLCCLLLGLAAGCAKPKPSQAQIDQFLEACKKDDMPAATRLLDQLSSRELLDAQADASLRDVAGLEGTGVEDMWSGWTALHAAAYNGNAALAKALIDAGADVNAKSANESTPLHWALGERSLDVVELLLDKGADVDARNEAGSTALLLAASEGLIPSVKLLVASGADVNAKSQRGTTPLHAASQEPPSSWNADLCATVELLIANGADVNARDEDGDTPLALARQAGNKDIAKILRERGAKE